MLVLLPFSNTPDTIIRCSTLAHSAGSSVSTVGTLVPLRRDEVAQTARWCTLLDTDRPFSRPLHGRKAPVPEIQAMPKQASLRRIDEGCLLD